MNALTRDITLKAAAPVSVARAGPYARYIKRILDIVLVLLGLPIALTLIAVMAVLIARKGGKPFYRQTRIGRDGAIFDIWKLRTMVPDAKAALEAYLEANPEARAEWDKDQKLREDPRITPLGARLRACSIDELPQIWNVLKGEMSLIGPRPMMPCQQVIYDNNSYYQLRPGITGLWQVSRRNEVSFAQRAKIDAIYASTLSFQGDMRILLKTVRVVLSRTGV